MDLANQINEENLLQQLYQESKIEKKQSQVYFESFQEGSGIHTKEIESCNKSKIPHTQGDPQNTTNEEETAQLNSDGGIQNNNQEDSGKMISGLHR